MRRRFATEPASQARDARHPEKNDARLARVERQLEGAVKSVDLLTKRLTALEAQVDYLASKVRPT